MTLPARSKELLVHGSPRLKSVHSEQPPWPNGWHGDVPWSLFEVVAVVDLGGDHNAVLSGGVLEDDGGTNLARLSWHGGAWFMRRAQSNRWTPEQVRTGQLPAEGANLIRELWDAYEKAVAADG